jgi:hypothetical protein
MQKSNIYPLGEGEGGIVKKNLLKAKRDYIFKLRFWLNYDLCLFDGV